MKFKRLHCPSGLTRTELLIVTVLLCMVWLVFFPPKGRRNPGVERVNCVANLKQIALGFQMWAEERGKKLPMQIPENQGGTLESALSGKVAPTFVRMSNELNSPKILVCGADQKRSSPRPAFWESVTDQNISYFITLDADYGNPRQVLTGDRHIAVGKRNREATGLVLITNASEARWTKLLHGGEGNLALADGSVQQATTRQLTNILGATGLATNRLVVP